MGSNATATANRFAGRLFSDDGRLCFVIDVDTELGFARVSCRTDSGQQVIQMPISEVGLRLSSSSTSRLDGLSTEDTSNRVVEQTDGWFFTTREGLNGPYLSDAEASLALSDYIKSVRRNSASSA